MQLLDGPAERFEADLRTNWHGNRSVFRFGDSWNLEALRLLQYNQTLVVELKVTGLLAIHVAVVDVVGYLLVPLGLFLDFLEGLQGTFEGIEAFLFDSTVVLDELPHLIILNDQENVYLAHL